MEEKSGKKPRADGQTSGLAGELFVAAELLKREMQTSITFGNAKAIDLFAHHPVTNKTFTIQVKTLRTNNYFLINKERISREHIYVFVLLNKPGVNVRYFIVPGNLLIDDPEKFGRGYFDPKLPGILPKDLIDFENMWSVFET